MRRFLAQVRWCLVDFFCEHGWECTEGRGRVGFHFLNRLGCATFLGYDTQYEFDFGAMTQKNCDSKTVRKIRRVASDDDADAGNDASKDSSSSTDKDYQWSWKDDNGLFAPFYDEDNDFIEKAYQNDKVHPLCTTSAPLMLGTLIVE